MEYVYKHMDWSNVEVLGRNRLPVRPFYCGYPNKESARQGRREECSNYRLLNGQWKFAYYESPFYVPDTCMEKAYDDREFGMMPVPGHWQLNGYDYPHYNDAIALFPILDDPGIQADNPTGVYRYTFQEEKQKDREYILRFDGVESAYHVWLNGTFIGYSQGPRNTAEFDVTEALQDGENVLAVIVYKFSDGSYLENQDMWGFAGIIRDVSLIRRPKHHMLDWRIVSDLVMEQNETTGKICLDAVFENHTEDEIDFLNYGNPMQELRMAVSKSEDVKRLMLQMIQEMDLDIVDFRVEEKENDRIEVFTKHIVDEYEAELNLFDESSGTKKLFGLLPFIAKSLLKGTTLVIDELDAKIHPVLLKYLIMTFSNMEKNKKGAQLIFTSHDLSTMNSEVFRRDEIWFVAKGNRQNSKLYSLVEFKNKKGESVRKDAKFDKQYLEGKYGADPYLRKIIDWKNIKI